MTASDSHPPPSPVDATRLLTEASVRVAAAIERWLPPESDLPAALHRAMRYSVFAGGKRIRPALVFAAAALGEAHRALVDDAAAALEFIHTYSLIHDDLPAMDDDRLRRGKPTCHVAFGEANAILAGDALLTLSFAAIAGDGQSSVDAAERLACIRVLAEAAGSLGMVGGQGLDLTSAADHGDPELLDEIHRRKTGALMGAATALGAIAAGITAWAPLRQFGEEIGTAFQIADDLLDIEGDTAILGKTSGKDQRARKLTYPSFHGIDASRNQAHERITRAERLLDGFGIAADPLRQLALHVIARTR